MPLIAYNLTGSLVTLAAGSPAPVLPISAAPPARGPGVNVTSELRGLSGPSYASLETQRPATVEYEWNGAIEYATVGLTVGGGTGVVAANSVGSSQVTNNSLTADDLGAGSVATSELADLGVALADMGADSVDASKVVDGSLTGTDIQDASVAPVDEVVADADGLSGVLVLRRAFTAGGGGAPADTAIYTANAPFKFRILDVQVLVQTPAAANTAQLRSATGGGGSALSDAFDTTTPGRRRDTGAGISNVSPTVLANGSLVLRRTDDAAAGEVIIYLRRET